MNYDTFLAKVKKTGVSTSPYLPFSLERIFTYPARDRSKKPVDAPPFIAQYWDAGGTSGGSCWDDGTKNNHYQRTGEPAPTTFPDLVKVLTAVCPNLTFLQYELVKTVIKTGVETEYEYYGNSSDYGYNVVILRDLYDKLVEIGALS